MADELGSLSQKARKTSLRSARIAMFFVGVITLAVNLFFALTAEKMVNAQLDKEVADLQRSGMVFDQAKLNQIRETAIQSTQFSGYIFAGMGVIFIALGLAIYKAPVPCTVTALVLFIGGWIATVAIVAADGEAEEVGKAIGRGIFIKIIIIVVLVKAIQSAKAYQREQESLKQEPEDDRQLEDI